ncbi:MAG: hypothetical protein ACREDQ_02660 [Limisphaerales bacterium]
MKRLSFVLIVAGGLVCCSASKANITGISFADDGDGAITCPVYTWSGSASDLSAPITGEQCWEPAHVVGTITTDTANDPNLILGSAIDNDTTFAWTAYQVNVYMNNTFSLSAASVTLPADWTLASIQTTAVPVVSLHGSYEAQILFTSGTPVAIGDELDFSYKISFSGATSYSFTQEMIPVPEPGTLGFLMAGVLLLSGKKIVQRRHNHSSKH